MSTFVCEGCGAMDNTALTRFWSRDDATAGVALCSACDAEGPWNGEWHGQFPQTIYNPEKHDPHWVDGEWR